MIVLLLCLTCLVAGFAVGGILAVRFALPKDSPPPQAAAPLISNGAAVFLLAIALWLFAWYLCKSLLRAMNGGGTDLPVLPFIGLVLLSAVLFVSTFAFAFHIFGLNPDEVSASGGDMLYFSTVTFSTLGYGDMSPPRRSPKRWPPSRRSSATCIWRPWSARSLPP
ncbi:potassium channel family protein [Tropicibacter naphthalenivorans]|uniref:Ion channel n=1 Tax=Tropicibacter naphthalenivorans TaxID=441103 RepID=A0A0P1G661_9RHOB|nr:potassium channel family protein [Tropicibacter naphthalenivorans]CUH77223.1 Ion channel [Tropicibacter naphthalenivorans]SMC59802.1 Ion channel [Tropicibacter naphthalenivorans]